MFAPRVRTLHGVHLADIYTQCLHASLQDISTECLMPTAQEGAAGDLASTALFSNGPGDLSVSI